MPDISPMLANIRRPRLLIRAARFGIEDYCRDRDLKRLLRLDRLAHPRSNLDRLVGEESRLEEERRAGAATYSVTRHIEMLIALIAEARLIQAQGNG